MKRISVKDTLSLEINDLAGEIWLDIPGYEDRYMISNYSRVKSIILRKHSVIKKTLSSGKFKVILTNKRGIRRNENIGRLTATVFIREPQENEVIRYKDGNVLYDIASNLDWTSRKECIQKAFQSGKFPKDHSVGIKNSMTKLQPYQIIEIRAKKSKGISNVELAKTYNVTKACISHIVNGRKWKKVN